MCASSSWISNIRETPVIRSNFFHALRQRKQFQSPPAAPRDREPRDQFPDSRTVQARNAAQVEHDPRMFSGGKLLNRVTERGRSGAERDTPYHVRHRDVANFTGCNCDCQCRCFSNRDRGSLPSILTLYMRAGSREKTGVGIYTCIQAVGVVAGCAPCLVFSARLLPFASSRKTPLRWRSTMPR